MLVDTGTSGAAELFASALVRQQARRADRRAHDRPRRASQKLIKLPDGSGLWLTDDALPHARRRAAAREGARADRRRRRAGRRVRPAAADRPIPSSTRRSSASRSEEGRVTGAESRHRASADLSVILTVRLTPVFSRCRRVAQRLERLLDTQEVGGSSPPVPTSSVGSAVTVRPELTAESRSLRASRHPRMSQVTVTLPDGSSRTVPAGHARPRRGGRRSRRASPRRRSPASSTAGSSISSYPARPRRVGPDRHRPEPRSAAALPPQHGASAGGRGDQPVPRRRSAASVRRPTKASSTTSSSPRPFVPEDLDAIEQKMKELAAQDLVYERQMWPREEAKAFFAGARRAAQGAADRREDRRPDARCPATRSRTGTPSSTSASARTCRRPAS